VRHIALPDGRPPTDTAHTHFDTGSGMGKANAAIVTTLLADRFGCSTIVFSGVAGGLDSALSIGDVVVADRVIQHNAGDPTDRLGYPADPVLLDRVQERLNGIRFRAKSSTAQCCPATST
jgi:nucleoside phosphorylase